MSYLNEFRSAIENEMCNDERIYQLYDVSPSEFYFLPRPAKWLSEYKRYNFILFTLGWIIRLFWLCGGFGLFFTYQLIKSFRSFLNTPNRLDEMNTESEFGLGFSSRALEVINKNSLGREPAAWIHLPWLNLKESNTQSKYYSLYSMLEFMDFFKAFTLSCQSVFDLWRTKTTSKSLLQGYTAYYWFLTRIALAKLKQTNFLTSEHFDRWAVLIDFVVSRLRSNTGNKSELAIVQHGLLGSLTAQSSTQIQTYKMKYKLRFVSSIYVYDNESAAVFKSSIIDSDLPITIHFFKPQISLHPIEKTSEATILFVGHPLCEDLQVYLFQELLKSTSLRAYYKPHPTCAPHQTVLNQQWVLIDNPLFYPAVDLLVSYPSTLVTEYSNHGTVAVVHPINLSTIEAGTLLNQIQNQIGKITL